MLNVPQEIKDLYKAGTARQHFIVVEADENPQLATIIYNRDIVRGSLRFTESCCSDSAFRFGGCERSMIEFDVVDVGNYVPKGKMIDCYLDIDYSSLDLPHQIIVQNNPGDGSCTTTTEAPWGGTPLYRLRLGRFQVTVNQPEANNPARRHIEAMSPKYWRASPVERAKLNWFSGASTYRLDPGMYFLANVGYWSMDFLENLGFTRNYLGDWDSSAWSDPVSFSNSGLFYTSDGEYRTVRRGSYKKFTITGAAALYGLSLGSFDAAGLSEFYNSWFGPDMDWEGTAAGDDLVHISSAEDFIRYAMFPACAAITHVDAAGPHDSIYPPYQRAVFDRQEVAFSTAGPVYGSNTWEVTIPSSLTVEIYNSDGDLVDSFTTSAEDDFPQIWRYSGSYLPSGGSIQMTAPVAEEFSYLDTWDDTTYIFRRWELDAEALIRGWMELNGRMLIPGRGVPKVVQLSADTPETVLPGNVMSSWSDLDQTDPITKVDFRYGKDHDQIGRWGGPGGSVYDLSDNGVLALASATTVTAIASVIQGRMSDSLARLASYRPAELTMPAWPWLEPGDALELGEGLDAQTTFLMIRELSGLQMITDEISSVGGDVAEEDEA